MRKSHDNEMIIKKVKRTRKTNNNTNNHRKKERKKEGRKERQNETKINYCSIMFSYHNILIV